MIKFYQNLYNLALRLIQKYGMVTTIKIPTPGSPIISGQLWNPTANTFGTKNVNMVFLPEESGSYYSEMFSTLEKEPYQVGYEYALLANEGLLPRLNMVVSRPNKDQAIRYVAMYAPAGVALLYLVGLKE